VNYYNDIDPGACAWTQELINSNLIAPGTVACKSITEVTPHELKDRTQVHFFNGISGWAHALDLAGWPRTRPVWCASLPCQSFSCAGQGGGFKDGRGQLWFPFLELVKKCRPQCIFGEQVKAAIGFGWLDRVFSDLEKEGYTCGSIVLGAHSIGAPHIRQRLFWVANSASGRIDQRPETKRKTESARRSTINGLEHTAGNGRKQWGTEPNRGSIASGRSPTERLDNAERGRCEQRDQGQRSVQQFGEGGGVGDSASLRFQGRNGSSQPEQGTWSGCPANFWSDAIWHQCRDGKARRVPPKGQGGLEPLLQRVVDGFPGSLDNRRVISDATQGFPLSQGIRGRVGLLKGYGNAIVPELAAEFVKAVMEI